MSEAAARSPQPAARSPQSSGEGPPRGVAGTGFGLDLDRGYASYLFGAERIAPSPRGVIHRGDCLDAMSALPDGGVRLVVTSPPYNIKNSSGNGLRNGAGGKWPKAALQAGYAGHDDEMPHAEYVAWQRECLAAMWRLLRPDGAIFYNHKWRVQRGLLQDRSDIVDGFPVRQILIWKRAGGINFNPGYFLPDYEVIYLIAKPDFRLAPKANAAGCVWEIPQESGRNPHPAPFPVGLAARCIESVYGPRPGPEDGPVLDPFLGSGTTAVAAERLGAPWIGVERSAEYAAMAAGRIARARAGLEPPADAGAEIARREREIAKREREIEREREEVARLRQRASGQMALLP